MDYYGALTELSLAISDHVSHFGTVKGTPNQSAFIHQYTSDNDWLVVIENDFLSDTFNMFGIRSLIPEFNVGLQIITGEINPNSHPDLPENIDEICKNSYALLHARYILTPPGLQAIRRKYESGIFGKCPRFLCEEQLLLPIGESPKLGEGPVRAYCPKCHDIFEADCTTTLDGAHFGPSFPHFFIQMHNDLIVTKKAQQMQFDFFGIPLEPKSEICPHRVIRNAQNIV